MGADRADPHFSTGEGSDADGLTRACVDWDARDERLAAHLPDHSWGRTAGVFERRITRRELELVVMPAGTASHSTWPGRAVPESVRSKLRQVRNPRPARGLAVGVGETAVPPSTLHRLGPQPQRVVVPRLLRRPIHAIMRHGAGPHLCVVCGGRLARC
jgi:hypothetical protein